MNGIDARGRKPIDNPAWFAAVADVAEIVMGNPVPTICTDEAVEQPAKAQRHLRLIPHDKRGAK